MQPRGWINWTWMLAFILGLTVASCAVQKSAVLIKDGEHEQQIEASVSSEPDVATKAKVQAAYGKLPLHFEVNQGQSDEQVKFLSRGMGVDELPGKSNYFIGNDPQNWHTNVPTYARVQYKDVYPGVNLVYYGNQRQLSKRARDWLPVPYPQ